ncbi:MAG: glycoside hydrolase family 3 N-terminal domain-containing protein, partial [Planctomycetota bacterium]
GCAGSGLDDLAGDLVTVGERTYAEGLGAKAQDILDGKVGSLLKVPGTDAANYLQKVAESSRLKIPLLIATDAIHGHGMFTSPATIFPTQIALASTFEPSLAEEMATLTRREMRATGYHWTFSPNVEIVRDQRWGRTGETFGEDTLLSLELGKAMVRGYQGVALDETSVLACVKHLVGGGEAFNGINAGDADLSERTLRSVHYPPFKACVDEGCVTLMAAHNVLNGIPCHGHKELLTQLLREEWGFDGFVVSDWNDVYRLHEVFRVADSVETACEIAVDAGIDVNMHGPQFHAAIIAAVEAGRLEEARIDAAIRPLLEAKFRLGLFENRYVKAETAEATVLCQAHRDAALTMAQKAIVLLKNENDLLPLEAVSSICVTGPSADEHFLLGDWSRPQPDTNVTTVLQGIRETAPKGVEVRHAPTGPRYFGSEEDFNPFEISDAKIDEVAAEAAKSDCAVVVVGDNASRFTKHMTSGENKDRASLDLAGSQTALITAIHATGTPVIVVLINTRAVAITWCAENVPAILEAWEPGCMGGKAIADILFGRVNPSGRLPISFPRSSGHLKCFYNHSPLRLGHYGDSPATPVYPFGHGLSYTTFEYSRLSGPETADKDDTVEISLDVQNTGTRDGEHVVLMYAGAPVSPVVRPLKRLIAFKRIHLKAGESRTVTFRLDVGESLDDHDANLKRLVDPGEYTLAVGDLAMSIVISEVSVPDEARFAGCR